MVFPSYLKKGDSVALVATARPIEPEIIDQAEQTIRAHGLHPVRSEFVLNTFRVFAGTDEKRLKALQGALDDPEIKAIWFARGGYGTGRLLPYLDWSKFRENPKWLIGFSDVCELHFWANNELGINTLHGPMCLHLSIPESKDGIDRVFKQIMGEKIRLTWSHIAPFEEETSVTGKLIGGNLTMLHNCQHLFTKQDLSNTLLLLEDVGEYYYRIDRMIWSLRRSGILNQVKALCLGGFSNMLDNEDETFGQSVFEIVSHASRDINLPIFSDLPIGHIPRNNPVVLGAEYRISRNAQGDCELLQL